MSHKAYLAEEMNSSIKETNFSFKEIIIYTQEISCATDVRISSHFCGTTFFLERISYFLESVITAAFFMPTSL